MVCIYDLKLIYVSVYEYIFYIKRYIVVCKRYIYIYILYLVIRTSFAR